MEVDPAAVNILEENVIDNAAINQVDLQFVVFQDQFSPVAVRQHDAVNLDNFQQLGLGVQNIILAYHDVDNHADALEDGMLLIMI